MTPEEIARVLQEEGRGVSLDAYDESKEPAGTRQKRIASLGPILKACEEAWSSGSEELDLMAEKLGDGGRDVAWRAPLGESGILEFFLKILAHDSLRQGLQVQALRVVGNSCADTDENRARVIDGNHLVSIINHLKHERLIPFTIPVIFNILVDYEPAQLSASESHLNQRLIPLLSSTSLADFAVFVPYFCKILTLLITQKGEALVANPDTVKIVLELANRPPFQDDIDDFISLVSVAASYLANQGFVQRLIEGKHMELFLSTFHHAHTHFHVAAADDKDTAEQVKALRSSLLARLADMTGLDAFPLQYPLQSQVAETLLSWLRGDNAQLQAAAFISLGNLSRSDEVSLSLVQVHFTHLPLIKILSNPLVDDAQLLHSGLSFLKNLAIPVQNKPHLGGLLGSACLPRIYYLDTSPQVQFTAISLTRLLLVNCLPNVGRICAPLSSNPSSPAHESSNVGGIISLYERSDAEPTRLEAARSIATICRLLHSNPILPLLADWVPPVEEVDLKSDDVSAEENRRRGYFYKKHHGIAKALSFLITQQKWPSLRSEAWFVFALMCRSEDGTEVILTVLQITGALTSLIKAITGRETLLSETGTNNNQIEEAASVEVSPDNQIASMADGLGLEPQQANPKQPDSMIRADRENALVMCTELLRTWGGKLPALRLSILQDLVKEGTEIVAAQKAAA